MADSINQKIVLTGADEVRRHLSEIAAAGQSAGNQTRAALLAATGGATAFSGGAQKAGVSAGALRFALKDLSFQVNDVATQLALGQGVMRTFASQGGQIFDAFVVGGGAGSVFGAVGSAISAMITPMRLAVVGGVALAAGFGLIVASASSSQDSIRSFDVILKGVGKSGETTGKDLEALAKSFRTVGLSTSEGRAAIKQGLTSGVKPSEMDKIIRTGTDLNAVLGEGSLEKFIAAAGQGGAPLQEFARRMGIATDAASTGADQFQRTSEAIIKSNEAIREELRKRDQALGDVSKDRTRSIADEQRSAQQQIADLTRERGTAKEEIELASARRIEQINLDAARKAEQINRDSERTIIEINRKRAKEVFDENEKALADYNKQLADSLAVFSENERLKSELSRRSFGARRAAMGPLAAAIDDIRVAWSNMITTLSSSPVVQAIATALADVVTAVTRFVEAHPAMVAAVAAFVVVLGTLAISLAVLTPAFAALTAVASPWLLVLGLIAAAIVLMAAKWDEIGPLLEKSGEFIKGVFTSVADWIGQKINSIVEFFAWLIQKATEAGTAIASAFSAGRDAAAADAGVPPGLAAGGLVRGRGTPTSDSIWARLSDGEFVIRAAVVNQIGVGALMRLNNMGSLLPRGGRSFAMGGLVTAGAAGGATSGFTIVLDGQSFNARSDEATAQALLRVARRRQALSAGRKPSTHF